MTHRNHPQRRGTIFVLALAVTGFMSPAQAADDFPPLFPFLISYDGPNNASSMAHLLDAPAGKYGFIRAEKGRFVNDAGPIRLHATNLTGSANFPGHEDADQTADRLARFGINCVRLHYMDAPYGNFRNEKQPSIVAEDPATRRNLDPAMLDRLDYLIAAFKKRGIYVNVNLHVARQLDARDGFVDGGPGMNKGVDNFIPGMIELQKEYARKLLGRVNPYTSAAYADEPCIAVVEINNENALSQGYYSGSFDDLPAPYAAELQRQWNEWLRKKYRSTDGMLRAWQWVATPLCDEQISEGKFDKPVPFDNKDWSLSLGGSEAVAAVKDGVLRLDVTAEGEPLFPKLFRAVLVKKGQAYTLSFRVRQTKGSGSVELGLAVDDTVSGWRSLGLLQRYHVGRDWKTVSYSFAAADDSDKARVELTRFQEGTYEIDDLSFQSGAKSSFHADLRLEDGTVPIVKTSDYAPTAAVRDFAQFLVDTETAYWVGISDYLKNELKIKSVISGTQLGYSPPYVQAKLDYIDSHAYWCHPSPVGPDWRIRNLSMVNSMSCILGLAGQRILGKPYTVSEYNHPFPNQYGAEGQPMLRAYGRLQGWDGVFEYTYNHRLDFQPQKNTYFFSILSRSDVLAHFPACAAIYLRGDVQEAGKTVVGAIDFPTYFDRLAGSKAIGASISSLGFNARQALLHKTAVDLSGKQGTDPASVEGIPSAQKTFVSDTGELTWNIERPGAGYFTVNTPNTKLFTGFPAGRTIAMGEVTLSIGKTRLDWATASLVSRHATGFGAAGKPANVLLAATGLSQNKGMTFDRVSETDITSPEPWGESPVCAEGIPATVTIPADSSRVRCFALDPRGDRKRAVPVQRADGGGSKIVLKPDYETVWYEIDIQ